MTQEKVEEKQINWMEEDQVLDNPSEDKWFKPETGTYSLVILQEPTLIEKQFPNDKELTQQIRLRIEVSEVGDSVPEVKKQEWDIGKGISPASLWGQLKLLRRKYGTLVGHKLTLNVTNDGKKNTYSVVEAIPLIKDHNKKMKNKK